MKNIIVAEAQGFCWGVRRALDIVDEHEEVSIYGDLIHNKQVVAELETNGKKVVHEVTGTEEEPIVITAHGMMKDEISRIKGLGLELVDTTCPLVSTIYQAGKALEEDGYHILIIGDKNHIEVKGIASRMHDPLIVNNLEDLANSKLPARIGIISQSTFSQKNFDMIVEKIRQASTEVKVRNTICAPTKKRQIAAEKLAKQVEIMIVVGGYHSSNTKKLKAMAEIYVESHHIETADHLQEEWFNGKSEIGIIAGASTADWIIDDVCAQIKTF